MSNPENYDSPQVKLMYEWGHGFNERNLDLIAKVLHKDFRYTTYPQSLGRPEQTREEWLEHIEGVMKLWTDHKSTIHSIIDTPGKVIVHFTAKGQTTLGVEMIRESINIGHIVTDEDGSLKIKQIEDFTDSKTYFDFVQAIAAIKAKK
ncbi:hypothetical protein BDM02DRAFT_3116652 [Thelephora ganbajun]|uniref:Uncharacterized protein n=1 Tax=Thelephora ganbajun TaxID=370292 RepID=A0ACB6ZE45_THEGA|nr:hypothetical protein BDM02DRAFT_3116652 [Thelephora ganbajun]